MISDFYKVTDSNELLNSLWWKKFVNNGFSLDRKNIVSVQWVFNGKLYEKPLNNNPSLDVLPNFDGLIGVEKTNGNRCDSLVVYEPDLTERFRIKPPVASEWAIPTEAYFYYVRFNKSNGTCECLFNDGHDGCVGVLDLSVDIISDIKKTRV